MCFGCVGCMDIASGTFDEMLACDSASALEGKLADFCSSLGFGGYSYLSFYPPFPDMRSYYATNYPDYWLQRYVEKNYIFCDPVLVKARTRRMPFSWDETTSYNQLSKKQKRICGEGSDAGIERGVSVPINGPNGEFSCLTFSFDGLTSEMNEIRKVGAADLILLGNFYHNVLWDKFFSSKGEPSPALTEREADILTWVARGKSSWDISVILGISEDGVKFHIRNACRKLGASSRVYAVTKAITMHLIRP